MELLDGKKTSERILEELKTEISGMDSKPKLEVILVGDDAASIKYVEMKQKAGEKIGAIVGLNRLEAGISTDEVVQLIQGFNNDETVTGILVQLPLPEGIEKNRVLESIDPKKDVDGLTKTNQELLAKNDPTAIPPATPKGIMALLDEYKIEISGKKVVIVNNSNIVGIPLSHMMKAKGGDVEICFDQTENLPEKTRNADILVTGIGKGKIIKEDMVKDGAVVIDVGIDFIDGKITGDIDFENVSGKCSYITPVPGGVGPMTVASLLSNLVADKRTA